MLYYLDTHSTTAYTHGYIIKKMCMCLYTHALYIYMCVYIHTCTQAARFCWPVPLIIDPSPVQVGRLRQPC